jgi:hypothetical protein
MITRKMFSTATVNYAQVLRKWPCNHPSTKKKKNPEGRLVLAVSAEARAHSKTFDDDGQ